MERNIIMNHIIEIFCDILERSEIIIDESSTPDTVEGWESLAHISILEAVQNEFSIHLSLDEMLELTSVGKIIDVIIAKQGQV